MVDFSVCIYCNIMEPNQYDIQYMYMYVKVDEKVSNLARITHNIR